MDKPISSTDLPYKAKARIADNVFLLWKRAGYSQEDLSRLAMVSVDRIGKIENGRVTSKFDSYVRLAGSLSVTVHDLRAGVRWTPPALRWKLTPSTRLNSTRTAPDGSDAPARCRVPEPARPVLRGLAGDPTRVMCGRDRPREGQLAAGWRALANVERDGAPPA
jgi:transcriptional regulator with XRE-family HTH domain